MNNADRRATYLRNRQKLICSVANPRERPNTPLPQEKLPQANVVTYLSCVFTIVIFRLGNGLWPEGDPQWLIP